MIAPIMETPNWNKNFEIMCDASDFSMGVVLGGELKEPLRSSTFLAKPSMKLKRIIQPLRMRC